MVSAVQVEKLNPVSVPISDTGTGAAFVTGNGCICSLKGRESRSLKKKEREREKTKITSCPTGAGLQLHIGS